VASWRYFLIDLFFDCFRDGSDSFLESILLKEACMGILRDRMVEEMKLRNLRGTRRLCDTGPKPAATGLSKFHLTPPLEAGPIKWGFQRGCSPPFGRERGSNPARELN
jgi:hypothetical protein